MQPRIAQPRHPPDHAHDGAVRAGRDAPWRSEAAERDGDQHEPRLGVGNAKHRPARVVEAGLAEGAAVGEVEGAALVRRNRPRAQQWRPLVAVHVRPARPVLDLQHATVRRVRHEQDPFRRCDRPRRRAAAVGDQVQLARFAAHFQREHLSAGAARRVQHTTFEVAPVHALAEREDRLGRVSRGHSKRFEVFICG